RVTRSATSFSRVPEGPRAPGSTPPWPASSITSGRAWAGAATGRRSAARSRSKKARPRSGILPVPRHLTLRIPLAHVVPLVVELLTLDEREVHLGDPPGEVQI